MWCIPQVDGEYVARMCSGTSCPSNARPRAPGARRPSQGSNRPIIVLTAFIGLPFRSRAL
jgi:hypothetical protein